MANDARLPTAAVDAVLIADTYPEMDNPPGSAVTLLKNLARSLKPQGRIGILNFTPGGGDPAPSERVAPETVVERAAESGLQLIKEKICRRSCILLVFGRTK